MQIVLVTIGSRGDAEPFCAVADALLADGAAVDLFLQPDVHHLAPTGCTIHELPFTQLDLLKFASNPSRGKDHPNPTVSFVGIVADVIGELVFPCAQKLLDASTNATAIMASSLARPLAIAISLKLDLPLFIVNLQPLMPTKDFPHYSHTAECVKALTATHRQPSDGNLQSYWELEQHQYGFLEERLQKVHASIGLASGPSLEHLRERLEGR